MTIEQVIYLWDKSNYKTLIIKFLPCVNHKGEIICGTGIYEKGQTILCGGEKPVYEYLKEVYKNSTFIYKNVRDYIYFEQFSRERK